MAKTPPAEAIANYIAIRYGSNRYIGASCPEALKAVQEEFERLVPIIFEDMSAGDVSQHGKKLSANYFKHLFDAKSGGQCRVRNTMLRFKPLQPRILCINDTPQEWLKAIEDMQDSDKLPLEKRLFCVHVDEFAISKEAVAEHEADLDAMVSDGKRRRLEYYSEQSIDISSHVSTTASGGASLGGFAAAACPLGRTACGGLASARRARWGAARGGGEVCAAGVRGGGARA